jgi:hypothetical protein
MPDIIPQSKHRLKDARSPQDLYQCESLNPNSMQGMQYEHRSRLVMPSKIKGARKSSKGGSPIAIAATVSPSAIAIAAASSSTAIAAA